MEQIKVKDFIICASESVVYAMKKIDDNASGIVFVVDDEDKLIGSATDGDIRRWLIKTGNLDSEISQVMNCNTITIFENEIDKASEIIKIKKIRAIPVLTLDRKVKDVVLLDDSYIEKEKNVLNVLPDVDVVIMAGGQGTRLYPYTKILPKPLIPVGDVPIIERIIESFKKFGIRNFYVSVNYHKAMIKSYFSEIEKDYTLNYIEENMPLGTAGSLKLLGNVVNKPVFVTNCDILLLADYEDIYKYHINSQNALTIVSSMKNITVPYGVIHSSEDGKIDLLEEKPQLSYFINTGVYILNPEYIDMIPDNTFFHMPDLAALLIQAGKRVGMYPISEDSFLDMGELSEMRRMENHLK